MEMMNLLYGPNLMVLQLKKSKTNRQIFKPKKIMKLITYSLIASQVIAITPISSKELIQDIDSKLIAFWGKEVSRVYCSSKSIGFDLHFNNKSGQLYSFNEFSNKLEPFRIESEIPLKDIIPYGGVDDFLWS